MRIVGVDAAVGHQAHQVQGGAVLFAVLHRRKEGGVLEEVAILDGLGDAGELLIDDAARADIRVADLAVAHLAVRQADIQPGGADEGHRILGHNFIQIRFVGGVNGVAVVGIVLAKAVHDAEYKCFFHSQRIPFKTRSAAFPKEI